jgi:amino acid adenylation domain-containing protein
MHEGMFFHHLIGRAADAYVLQTAFRIRGSFDSLLFERALDAVLERHELLRSVFLYKSLQKPRLVTLKNRRIRVEVDDLAGLDEEERNRRIDEAKESERRRGFDLGRDLLMRVRILKTSDESATILWTYHHILFDGWGFGIVVAELLENLAALRAGAPLPTRPVESYSGYVRWLERQDRRAAEAWWEKRLAGYESLATLPRFGRDRGELPSAPVASAEVRCRLDAERTAALRALASAHGLTLSTVVQTIWGLALARYNNSDDVVFGAVVSGRPAEVPGIERMVGLFINTIPLRITLADGVGFLDLAREVQESFVEAERHAFLPLVEIQDRSERKGNLFDHVVVFENYPLEPGLRNLDATRKLGFEIEGIELAEATHYDLTVIVTPGDELELKLVFDPAVFPEESVRRLGERCQNVVSQILDDPSRRATEIDIVPGGERRELLFDLNSTEASWTNETTLTELFEAQVRRTPHATALVDDGRELTYAELSRRAGSLAAVLRESGVGRDRIVGLLADRSIEMITGMLAILKAGGAFLPLDPGYPTDRLRYMLEDSEAALLLTTRANRNRVPFAGEVIELDDPALVSRSGAVLPPAAGPDDLVYVIYTSGTTGKPKGVALEHRNLVNLIRHELETERIDFGARVLNFVTVSFDVCYQEIFSTLLAGGRLFIISDERKRDVSKLLAFLSEHAIEVAFFPTSYFSLLASDPGSLARLPNSLRQIITAGEQLVVREELKRFLQERRIVLHNHYGPSETHVVTTFRIDPAGEIPDLPPIGRPIANTAAYVLDRRGRPQPVGVDGELVVSGDSVGRGYIRRPELTAERFVPDPFRPGWRMYRTGDLARWLPDGNLEFRGRIDGQVKIRGFRVELGEIETELLALDSVKSAAVTVKADPGGTKSLCAYVVPARETTDLEIRTSLEADLPDFMIPSYIVQIPEIPLRPSGKVDWAKLPAPEAVVHGTSTFVPPRTVTEERLAGMFREVLGVGTIGIDDDFFLLGGHSLKAVSLASRIAKGFGVDLPLGDVFRLRTVRQIAGQIERAGESVYAAIEPVEKREFHPLSSAQRRFYLLQEFDPEGTAYNMPALLEIEGALDRGRLEAAFSRLVERHEQLRASFFMKDGAPVQRIAERVPFVLRELEATEGSIENLARSFVRPFDLSRAPLLRAALLRLAEDRHLLFFDMHHIVSDGATLELLTNDLASLYADLPLPERRIDYTSYAAWQNEFLHSDRMAREREFWLSEFGEPAPVLNLPTDFPRPPVQSFVGEEVGFTIDSETTARLRMLAAREGSTLFMLLLAAYSTLLMRITGQEDLVVGTPVAGRRHADLQQIVGLFVNTLALRLRPRGDSTFRRLLAEVREKTIAAFDNQDYQFEELVDRLSIRRDVARNPLFDTLFVLQTRPDRELRVPGLLFRPMEIDSGISKLDLSLGLVEKGDRLEAGFEFATKLFRRNTIERMAEHFRVLLRSIADEPDRKLSELEILSADERRQVVSLWNRTDSPYSRDRLVQRGLEERAAASPDRIAVEQGGEEVTYGELNARANRLAHLLRQRGVGRESVVAIAFDPCPEMVAAIFGVLKAGGAYLPIDPDAPAERTDWVLGDAGCRLLVTTKGVRERVRFAGEVIALEAADDPDHPAGDLPPAQGPSDLVYVIYTSGSTGKPKGVLAEQRNVACYVHAFQREFAIGERDVVVHLAPYTFDAFVEEFYPTFDGGARFVIPEKDAMRDARQLHALMQRRGVTFASCSPLLLAELDRLEPIPSLRIYVSGADVLKWEYISNLRARGKVYNTYGPTEATVCATYHDCSEVTPGSVPIGRPIANYRVYVLDRFGNPNPIGVPGELSISGDGVARGYLRRPELSELRFGVDPFRAGVRMYRTGDLARWRTDGTVEFLGRIDSQIKLRGFRIEPGEIEAELTALAGIREAIVLVHEDDRGDKALVAHFVADRSWTVTDLREALGRKLPPYMIPSFFVPLPSLPRTREGKVDKKALPDPKISMPLGTDLVLPRDPVEAKIADIWEDVLTLEKIGVDDNFFALGGHSLKALLVMNRIRAELRVDLGLEAIFRHPTVARLADVVRKAVGSGPVEEITPVPQAEFYETSHAQKRLFVLHRLDPSSPAYNMPGRVTLEGGDLEPIVRRALERLTIRHESLRTRFALRGDEPVQIVERAVAIDLPTDDLRSLPVGERETRREAILAEEAGRPFDLAVAPLFRARFVRLRDDLSDLVFVMHHIVTDGWSMELLRSEFWTFFEALREGRAPHLPPLPVQYKDFAAWQNRSIAGSPRMQQARAFWIRELSADLPPLPLPTDAPRAGVTTRKSAGFRIVVPEAVQKELVSLAKDRETSLFVVLLAAWNAYFARLTHERRISLGLAVAGREHESLRDLIGFFINTVVLASDVDLDEPFTGLLDRVAAKTISALDAQSYPLELAVEELKIPYPTISVFVNMLNIAMGKTGTLDDLAEQAIPEVQEAKFELVFYISEFTNGIEIVCNYWSELFEPATVAHLVREIVSLLERIAKDPSRTLREMTDPKRRKISRPAK